MDDLALFLATRDPVRVAREWTRAGLEQALLERPTMSMPRRRPAPKMAAASFAAERAGRMLAELNDRKENTWLESR